ncbi:hypothetical protein [Zooshikella harenae]|uniref:Calponin-homology (CH) domain-containing protein n=1 Tax=Zooshikella harenae TaxID=2827238 RepID=A0ABS5Z885_9GAMM|nr:hypothetical protein [Zooshikella harenae]MBU2710252.1 hypothetical protein [Zooshikella harenae]
MTFETYYKAFPTADIPDQHELVSWVNDCLKLNYTKIEDFRSGAAYCQLMDILYENCVRMEKVNFQAKEIFELVINWKLLSDAFKKAGIYKPIPVNRLITGNFTENLAFCVWFKNFFDTEYGGQGYNPVATRNAGAFQVE